METTTQFNQVTLKGKLADAFPDEECYTIEEVAQELGVSKQHTENLLSKAAKRGLIQKLTKLVGNRKLYAPPTVDALVRARKSGALGQTRKSPIDMKNAHLIVTVPVYDPNIAEIVKAHFGSGDMLREWISGKLAEFARPKLMKLEEIEQEYQKEKEMVFRSFFV